MTPPRDPPPPDRALAAWAAMVALTLASVGAAGATHAGGGRLVAGLAVAAIAWIKAWLLLRHFMAVREAGPTFTRIALAFAALAPAGLAVVAIRGAAGG